MGAKVQGYNSQLGKSQRRSFFHGGCFETIFHIKPGPKVVKKRKKSI